MINFVCFAGTSMERCNGKGGSYTMVRCALRVIEVNSHMNYLNLSGGRFIHLEGTDINVSV